MSSGTLPQVPGLQSLLGRCQSLVRVHTCVRGLAETLCILILWMLACGIADYLIVLPGIVRAGTLVAGICLTLFVAWRRFLRPLMSSASVAELGAAVDLKFPELQESIATLISIENPEATASELGSAQMRKRIYQHVETQVQAIRPTQVVPARMTWHRFMMLSIAGGVLLLPFIIWPSGAQLLLQRLLMPYANLAAATNLYFEVPDGNRVVATGTDVTFVAIPQWRNCITGDVPTDVVLEMKTQDDRLEELPMSWDESQRQFTASLVDARQTLRYRVTGDGASTEWFTMTVADAPRIVAASLVETPPAYTARPVRTIDGVLGDIHVFERSKVVVQLTFNKPVKPATLTWKDWTPLPVPQAATQEEGVVSGKELLPEEIAAQAAGARMEGSKAAKEDAPVVPVVAMSPDRMSAVMEFDALGSGAFEFSIVDDLGLRNFETTPRRLISTLDTPPVLTVKGVADGLEVRPDDTVPLNCDVTDDIGVGAVELHYRRNEDAMLIEVANLPDRGATAVSHQFLLGLASLNVKSGDRVELRVKASDERPSPGPQVVWKGPWVLTISDNAEALGQKALREADKQLVEALRAMEQQLQEDAKQANSLKDEAWRNWNEESKDKTRGLSEKEQTQGNDLQKLAQQVAQHPLMQKQADKLAELAQQVRQQLPKKLDEAAAAADKEPAAKNLQESVNDLNRIRDELHRATDEIEKAASLEQELAELNRLALDAEQLAKESEQHQQKKAQDQPAQGQSREDFEKELQDERAELQQDQQELSQDLNSLLQRKQELLQAAREAQLDEAALIAEQMQQLARQQQQLAEGVNEEARDAAQDAQEIANSLQQARNEADQLNRRMEQQAPDVPRTEIPPLDEAIRDLRQGNLSKPEQQISDSAEQLERAAEELKKPAPEPQGPAPADDAAKAAAQREQEQRNTQRAEMQKKSEELAGRMNELEARLEEANQERGVQEPGSESNEAAQPNEAARKEPESNEPGQENPKAGQNGEQSNGAEQNAEQGNQQNQQNSEQDRAAESARKAGDLMTQLEKLTEAAREQSEALKQDASTPNNVRNHAEQSAQRAEDALRHANAGQFQRTAERMRNAAGEASRAADQMNQEGQQDRKEQLEQQRENFDRLADAFNRLQQDDAAQLSAQRTGQQQVAQQAAQTPDALSELSESLNNPALGMQHLARPAQEAAQAAQQAAQSGQQAGQQLQQGQIQQAGQNAQEAAGQLNRAAQLAQQASQGHRDPNNLVPTEVGESVADAMQSLQRASEMMNNEASQASANSQQAPEGSQPGGQEGQQGQSGQDGQNQAGQPGQEGQPGQQGEGQPGQQGQPGKQGQGQQGNAQQGQQGQPGQSGTPQDSQGSQAAQPGEGGSPNGQRGSAQQMAKAAQALKQAAKGALPSQFSPGQLNSSADPSQGDPQGQGNPAEFDGASPNATTRRSRARNWGRLQDELDPDVKDAGREVMDSEYSEIIRRYRRDLAKAAAANSETKPAAKP